MTIINKISGAIEAGQMKTIGELIEEALAEDYSPVDVLHKGMIQAMDDVGEKFKNGEIFVPEMMVAAQTMKVGLSVLKPRLAGDNSVPTEKFIIATVEGDLHDIGKNLVGMMLESAGFEVIDLGTDVSPEKLVSTIKENPDCKIVGLSCLLTTTMPAMRETVATIADSGLNNQVKVVVGGAPISEEFAKEIGADAYASDAGVGVQIAKQLVAN